MTLAREIEAVPASEFHVFGEAVAKRWKHLSGMELFVTEPQDLFASYLSAFPEGTNPMYRERTEHDCSCCKAFVRNLGRLVAIDAHGNRLSVWDVPNMPEPYRTVAKRLDEIVKQLPIVGVFRTKERKYGNAYTWEDDRTKWHHFVGEVAPRHFSTKPEEARGQIDTTAQVFRRGLDELKATAFDEVIDLIESKSIYRGEEHLPAIRAFRKLIAAYQRASDKDAFVWSNYEDRSARFRNTVIGSLIIDLSEGMDIERAVKAFETKVAPTNYKRPTAIITAKMVENAVAKLKELGLEGAVNRRYAQLGDVSVNNVLFVDNAVRGEMRDGLTSLLMEEVAPAKVDIKKATDISMADFVQTILPKCRSIEALVQQRHLGNFVSLTAPVDGSTGRLFRWNNDFAWSYDGEVADSVKQRVKKAGGNINAKLRVSLSWFNFDDLDLHATLPNGVHIFYGHKQGILDVDMNAGSGTTREPVENLAFTHLPNGTYKVWVNQYSRRESSNVGFDIEIEHEGVLRQFSYANGVSGNIECFQITVERNAVVAIQPSQHLRESSSSIGKWGVSTENLIRVDTLMASPNHWDGNEVGNKHWFFFLHGCVNPDSTRGIYNEFLRPELEPHRKVFEVLGSKTKCPPSPKQLSGVGFSSTRGDTLTVVAKGDGFNRAFNIAF